MRTVLAGAASLLLTLGVVTAGHAGSGVEQILERYGNANRWRDHVMVVAHRGGGLEAGKTRYPENSMASIRGVISSGAEMVEIDIRRSKDGELIVMHDSWLDRTTNCKGEVIARTMDELRHCRLVVEGTGAVTAESVPTLREMLEAPRARSWSISTTSWRLPTSPTWWRWRAPWAWKSRSWSRQTSGAPNA